VFGKFAGRITSAHVIALIALFVAIGGASYAALKIPNNSVGAKQLKKNAVTSKKVRNRSLKKIDFAKNQLPKGPRGTEGPQGQQGTQGTPGAGGVTGPTGPQGPTASAGGSNPNPVPLTTVPATAVSSSPLTVTIPSRLVASGQVQNGSLGGANHSFSCEFHAGGLTFGTATAQVPMNLSENATFVGTQVVDPGTYTVDLVCTDATNGSTIAAGTQITVIATGT
jgi:hypothetical protein